MIVLSATPCCADYDCLEKVGSKKDYAQKTPAKEKECPGCSPFFTCGSCVGFIVAKPFTLNVLTAIKTSPANHSIYQQPIVEEASPAIWQPPKIS